MCQMQQKIDVSDSYCLHNSDIICWLKSDEEAFFCLKAYKLTYLS